MVDIWKLILPTSYCGCPQCPTLPSTAATFPGAFISEYSQTDTHKELPDLKDKQHCKILMPESSELLGHLIFLLLIT